MIAIFTTEKEAQEFSDKCHKFLTENCPNYNAQKWCDIVPNKDKTAFSVSIPHEYEKELYQSKIKITEAIKSEIQKAVSIVEKTDSTFEKVTK